MYSRFIIHQERKLRSSVIVLACGIAAGLLYPVLGAEFDRGIWPFMTGVLIGLLCSGYVILNELTLKHKTERRSGFLRVVILTSFKYTLVFGLFIVMVILLFRPVEQGLSYSEYLTSGAFSDFVFREDYPIILIYALIATFLVVFTRQLSRKLGQDNLYSLVTGKYREPITEERIFLLMDLVGSVKLGEKLDLHDYHALINDFFFDVTGPVLSTRGEIYQYAGDQIIISWPYHIGIAKANCLHCHFRSKMEIHSRREYYLNRYGVMPKFTSGLHYGEVVTGSIGYIKSEIVFSGEVLFQTNALEKACKEYNVELIISEPLKNKIEIPIVYAYQALGKLELDNGGVVAYGTIIEQNLPDDVA